MASYLFLTNNCPLPGLGNLFITITPAQSDFLNKTILPPTPCINFSTDEIEAKEFLQYVATKTNTSIALAEDEAKQFCSQLKNACTANSTATIKEIGQFFIDNKGHINFKPIDLSPIFLPPANANKVIHTDAEHRLLVGDKETTNAAMTEFFAAPAAAKNRWWIGAIIIAVVALLIILFYFINASVSQTLGNAVPIY